MNKAQNRQLHGLLTQTGLVANKAALVFSFTAGRSESSADLTETEADQLIAHLKSQPGAKPAARTGDPMDTMRKKMIHYARSMGWEVEISGGRQADMQRLNNWCIQYGQFHKGLMAHDHTELTQLLTQFEVVYRSFLKGF